MADITVVEWSDSLTGQEQYKATGMDKHGGFHDYYATTEEEAYEGCLAEIEEANEDE
jgi:hypothetical protein